jgi:protein tyrosine phosphatase
MSAIRAEPPLCGFILVDFAPEFGPEAASDSLIFQSIPTGNGKHDYASKSALKSKQRFQNIVPCEASLEKLIHFIKTTFSVDDHNRIQLQMIAGQALSDYINASYVDVRATSTVTKHQYEISNPGDIWTHVHCHTRPKKEDCGQFLEDGLGTEH